METNDFISEACSGRQKTVAAVPVRRRFSLFELKQAVVSGLRAAYACVFGSETCLCCGAMAGGVPICRKCVENHLMQFVPPGEGRCAVCGKPLVSEQKLCMDCRTTPVLKHTDFVLPLYQYRLWRKMSLFSWKIEERRALSAVFASAVDKALFMLFPSEKPVVVPVPPRPGKIRNKGWDQVDELCMFLERRYGYEVLPLLERTTVMQQKKLDREQRLEMKGRSYVLRQLPKRTKAKMTLPAAVVLIDDVLTTGVTVESCAALLKEAGVSKVGVLTLFIVD